MEIRPIAAKDRESLAALLRRIDTFSPPEISCALELIDLALTTNKADYQILVATKGDPVVGYVCYGPTPMTVGTFDLYWIACAPKAQLSDALKAARPKGGEHFGLYLLDKKVGYAFNDLSLANGTTDKAKAVSEFFFRANVGDKVSERRHTEVRLYEAKPGGRLLSFTIEDKGDGGEQRLEGEARPDGIRVVRKRPGRAVETLNLPATGETIEDADQPRVAVFRGQPIVGSVLDGQDLDSYKMTTTLKPSERRLVRGVNVPAHPGVSTSDKGQPPTQVPPADNAEIGAPCIRRSRRNG